MDQSGVVVLMNLFLGLPTAIETVPVWPANPTILHSKNTIGNSNYHCTEIVFIDEDIIKE